VVSGVRLTFTPAEMLAGISFLESHAPETWIPILEACREGMQRFHLEEKREALRERPCDELLLNVRAERAVLHVGCATIRDVEKLMGQSDTAIRARYGHRTFSKIALRNIRDELRKRGLNH
jgi:hypothetical protein